MTNLNEANKTFYNFNRNHKLEPVSGTAIGSDLYIYKNQYSGWSVCDLFTGLLIQSGFAKQADAKAFAKNLPEDIEQKLATIRSTQKYKDLCAEYERLKSEYADPELESVSEAFDELDTLNSEQGELFEAKKDNYGIDESELHDVSELGVRAENKFWKIKYSREFENDLGELVASDRDSLLKNLNKNIPNIKIDGRWTDSEFLVEHRFPIVEIKLGNGKTGQPIRVLGFTLTKTNHGKGQPERTYVLGAAIVHKDKRLSKDEREKCDRTFRKVNML